MSTHRVPQTGAARDSHAVVAGILNGSPWCFASIKHNNLRQQCRNLAGLLRRPLTFKTIRFDDYRRLWQVVANHTDLLRQLHPSEIDFTSVLLRMAAYAAHWRRLPESWKPDALASPREQWVDLLRHLFQAYELPGLFASAWLTQGELHHVERDWFCHAAAGGSLRTAPGMPRSVTARALHLMMQAPDHLSVRQALRWGQARAAGCRPRLIWEILRSGMVHDLSNDALWFRLMQKFAAMGNTPASEWSWVMDGLRWTMAREGLATAQRLIDLPLTMLRRHSRKLFQSLLSLVQADGEISYSGERLQKQGFRNQLIGIALATWRPLPHANWRNVVEQQIGHHRLVWTFHELLNLSQLLAEAKVLKHCVVTYRKKCLSGESVIFSLRSQCLACEPNITRELTLEIDRRSRKVIQVRGKWNRRATTQEIQVIHTWARNNGLEVAI